MVTDDRRFFKPTSASGVTHGRVIPHNVIINSAPKCALRACKRDVYGYHGAPVHSGDLNDRKISLIDVPE